VIKKPVVEGEVIEEDNLAAERAELQAQIASLPIKDLLSLNEFLNPETETILDEDTDIFASVVEHYSVDKEGDESYESDTEEVEKVPIAKALSCLEIVKLWKLQQEDSEVSTLQALDRIGREMAQNKSSRSTQTTIKSFFEYKD
jgi:hypothetical protein